MISQFSLVRFSSVAFAVQSPTSQHRHTAPKLVVLTDDLIVRVRWASTEHLVVVVVVVDVQERCGRSSQGDLWLWAMMKLRCSRGAALRPLINYRNNNG